MNRRSFLSLIGSIPGVSYFVKADQAVGPVTEVPPVSLSQPIRPHAPVVDNAFMRLKRCPCSQPIYISGTNADAWTWTVMHSDDCPIGRGEFKVIPSEPITITYFER